MIDHQAYSDDYIKDILQSVKTIALVGASANPARASNTVLKYLLEHGYNVWPINPGLAGKKLHGQPVYASLEDLPATPDMIDIFRNSEAAGQLVYSVLSGNWQPRVIWMQLDIKHEKAAAQAEAAGIKVVMDRCPKIEIDRLLFPSHGGLS